MENKEYFTVPELAQMLGISRVAVFKKIKSGEIKASKIGRNFAIPKEEFDGVLGRSLSERQKKTIEDGVGKTIKEYGKALELLGKE